MREPIHVNVAVGVGLPAVEPGGVPGVRVESHTPFRPAALVPFHRFAVRVEGYGALIVEEGVVVEFLRGIEGKPLFFGVGLLAASVGGEEDSCPRAR